MENMADTARKAGIIPEWPKPPKVMPTPPPPRLIKEGSKGEMILTMVIVAIAFGGLFYMLIRGMIEGGMGG